MYFDQFAQHLQELENNSSRLTKTALLAKLWRKLSADEIKPASYLMQGRVVPNYESLEFNLSEKMVLRALAQLISLSSKQKNTDLFGQADLSAKVDFVKKRYRQIGDLGLTVQQLLESLPQSAPQKLSLLDVFHRLVEIADFQGSGSQDLKLQELEKIWRSVKPLSAKFITRIVLGKMRLGFSLQTMIDSLSWAVAGDKSERNWLERAYNQRADLGELAGFYLSLQNKTPEDRKKELFNLPLRVLVPVVPALCQRLNTAQEMIEKMRRVIVEPKYDGLRIQLHFSRRDKQARAFTRNLEDIGGSLPEVRQLAEISDADSFILDTEAIGFDPKTGKLLDFQQTITRRRKYGVQEKSREVPMRFYIFDLLLLNGRSLLAEPLRKRKELLIANIHENENFKLTPFFVTDQPEKIQKYHRQVLGRGLEGVVVKQEQSVYRSGRKGWRWVKMKEKEGTTGKLSDTLDLVVMGYFLGKGKRAQFGLGAILVGVRDGEKIKTVSKIGTGMTDRQLGDLKKRCQSLAVEKKPGNYIVPKEVVPDIWVEPKLVLEIAADEVTHSPLHSAKLALRFPRLVKIRDDKNWQDATSLSELRVIGGALIK